MDDDNAKIVEVLDYLVSVDSKILLVALALLPEYAEHGAFSVLGAAAKIIQEHYLDEDSVFDQFRKLVMLYKEQDEILQKEEMDKEELNRD